MLELKLKLQFSEFQLITLFISSRLFNSVSLGLGFLRNTAAAAAAAKSLQSCPTPCDPHRRQPTRLPRSWDSPGKNTGVGCHFLLQCMKVKVKLLNRVRPQQPQGPQPSRLLPPWDFPGKSTGVGFHCLLCRGRENDKRWKRRGLIPLQLSSITQSCPTLCNPLDCITLGFPVHHQLPETAQTHVHRVGDVIQSSNRLSSPSPPAFNLSQHQVFP